MAQRPPEMNPKGWGCSSMVEHLANKIKVWVQPQQGAREDSCEEVCLEGTRAWPCMMMGREQQGLLACILMSPVFPEEDSPVFCV